MKTIYVSPKGNDANSGTYRSPLLTAQRAKEAAGLDAAIDCILLDPDGSYQLGWFGRSGIKVAGLIPGIPTEIGRVSVDKGGLVFGRRPEQLEDFTLANVILGRSGDKADAFSMVLPGRNILFRDVVVTGCGGIALQSGVAGAFIDGIDFTRVLMLNITRGPFEKCSAIYTAGCRRVKLDRVYMDMVGWVLGESRSIYNHGYYCQGNQGDWRDCENIEVHRSIFSRCSSHPTQLRAGGSYTANIEIECAVGTFSMGGIFRDNILLFPADLGPKPEEQRQWGWEFKAKSQHFIGDNIAAFREQVRPSPAFKLASVQDVASPLWDAFGTGNRTIAWAGAAYTGDPSNVKFEDHPIGPVDPSCLKRDLFDALVKKRVTVDSLRRHLLTMADRASLP